jgi:hypothetical protein
VSIRLLTSDLRLHEKKFFLSNGGCIFVTHTGPLMQKRSFNNIISVVTAIIIVVVVVIIPATHGGGV